jgi:RIO kinase 1
MSSTSTRREEPADTRFSSRASDASDMAAMQEFIDEGAIRAVLGVVKSGKEATVYRCRAGREFRQRYLAAKVYHDASHRTFQHAKEYTEGRVILNGQVRRAVEKRTDAGREFAASMWVNSEFETLSALGYAGADVPEVFASTDKAILMEYLGDETGAAPYLQHAKFDREEAETLFERLLWNIELWLGENVVHGDLSPFNILYTEGRLVVIDFPQAVDPRMAPAARRLLERDVANVCKYFTRHGIEADAAGIARDLWERFTYGALTP